MSPLLFPIGPRDIYPAMGLCLRAVGFVEMSSRAETETTDPLDDPTVVGSSVDGSTVAL